MIYEYPESDEPGIWIFKKIGFWSWLGLGVSTLSVDVLNRFRQNFGFGVRKDGNRLYQNLGSLAYPWPEKMGSFEKSSKDAEKSVKFL
jgi:hypothetical protein